MEAKVLAAESIALSETLMDRRCHCSIPSGILSGTQSQCTPLMTVKQLRIGARFFICILVASFRIRSIAILNNSPP
jgi:hypothetical protein